MPTNAHDHDPDNESTATWPDWAADAIEEAAGAAIASTSLTTAASRMAQNMIAVETIDANGETMFWLTVRDLPQGGGWRPEFAPHELTGALPSQYKRLASITCAAVKRSGGRCRNYVKRSGDLCPVHGGERR
jgi:hypothetical protein